MRKVISISSAGLLCFLAGCDLPVTSPHPLLPTAYHGVAYYDTHPFERGQTNSWCRDNPGLATKIPSCDSADTSDIHAWHRKMGWE
jgi:hypothetical protein